MGNFIIFIIVLFAIAALLRIDFFFTILYLFILVFIVSEIWSRRILRQLRFERRMPRRAFSGDTLTVRLTFKNESLVPIPWLMFTESVPPNLSTSLPREAITLGGKASHTTQYTITARKRGYYRIGPLSAKTGDILGIRQEISGRFEPTPLIVYPRIIPITKLSLPTHSPQVVLSTPIPIFQDASRLTGVRGYTPGDNPRHIHWPATAATGQLLVKQFQPAIARDSAIFLNLDRADYSERGYPDVALELAIITAASLANHIATIETLPVGLVTTGFDPLVEAEQSFNLPPHKGRNHLIQILEVLARIQDVNECDFLGHVRRQAVHLSWGTTLIIITSHTTESLRTTLFFLKRSGFRVMLVLVDPHRARALRLPETTPLPDVLKIKVRSEKDIEAWVPYL